MEDRMLHYLSALATVGGLAAVLLAPGPCAGKEPILKGAAPDAVTWKLDRLSQEPFKLLKATPEPSSAQVRFLVEFTRPITLAEEIDWQRGAGPVLFRFLDEDGVVIQTVKPQWEGEMVPKKGARLRIVLPMPDVRVLNLTHSIVAD
jgi:hypothetical protein